MTFTVVALIASGCASKTNNNQMKQQAVPRTQMKSPAKLTNVNNSVQIANQAASKIVKITGVKQANVLVMGKNAYVAAVVDKKHDPITQHIKNQIANQVKATDRNIQHVYVSTNPNFVNSVNKYVADVKNGRPVSGFFNEFSTMIRKLFPTAK
jgi:YhcN/YlaJ family sporulation lipoprotein